MIEIFKNTNYNFLSRKRLFIGASWILILAGLASVLYKTFDGNENTPPFNMGVDFAGGTLASVKFASTPDLNRLRNALAAQGIESSKITLQQVGDEIGQAPKNEVLVRLPNLISVQVREGQSVTAAKATDDADIGKQKILAALATFNAAGNESKVDVNRLGADDLASELQRRAGLDADRASSVARRIVDYREDTRGGLIGNISEVKNLGGIEPQIGTALDQNFFAGAAAVRSVEAVSPQVGADLRNRAILVTLVSCLGMLVYIVFRFKSWGFGIGALIAVFHDVVITLGIFSIMQWEINLTVIAALLTLVGYSMNDTIIIFDRIREMMKTRRREGLETVANDAINQTLSRTVITSGLTLLTVTALLVFGGEVLRSFSWVLFIGIIIGTYSSIYIASPFMLFWESWRARSRAAVAGVPVSGPAAAAKAGAEVPTGSVTDARLAAAGISTKPRRRGK
ncbi:MAG: protein translocase subunit SecF [Acidobacteriota bacterium]|nr:MAG: protein translocase subunit SecF [Acidobacteriota bacterium]